MAWITMAWNEPEDAPNGATYEQLHILTDYKLSSQPTTRPTTPNRPRHSTHSEAHFLAPSTIHPTHHFHTYCPTCRISISEANGARFAQHHILSTDESSSGSAKQPVDDPHITSIIRDSTYFQAYGTPYPTTLSTPQPSANSATLRTAYSLPTQSFLSDIAAFYTPPVRNSPISCPPYSNPAQLKTQPATGLPTNNASQVTARAPKPLTQSSLTATNMQTPKLNTREPPQPPPTRSVRRVIRYKLRLFHSWLLRTFHPSTVRQYYKDKQLAQLIETLNSGRSRLHTLPVELLLKVAEHLEPEDREAMRRTCKWFKLIA